MINNEFISARYLEKKYPAKDIDTYVSGSPLITMLRLILIIHVLIVLGSLELHPLNIWDKIVSSGKHAHICLRVNN